MTSRIEVDPIKCEAHGLCAELLPERISLDEWGYPLIDPAPVPLSLEDLARRTIEACPTLALRLVAAQRQGRVPRPTDRTGRPPVRDPRSAAGRGDGGAGGRPSYRVHRAGR